MKTTYYLRTMGATHAEKSTVKAGQLNAVPADGGLSAMPGASAAAVSAAEQSAEPRYCAIDDPTCEACQ